MEEFLDFAIEYPEIPHFHALDRCCLILLLSAHSGGVVDVYGGRRLRVSKLLEYKVYYLSFLCIKKECPKVSFSGWRCNKFENGAGDRDCTIDDYWLRVLQNTTKEEVTSCRTSCLGGTEVGRIRVYIKNHVWGPISDFRIRVRPHVVKELAHTCKGFLSWGTLLCGNSR